VNIFTFIVATSLAFVVIAWCIDNGVDLVSKYRTAKRAQRETEEQKAARALLMLTIAGLHKNARVIYTRKPSGDHRFVRTS